MTVRDDMVNGHGLCHGGLVATLADSAFALACNSRGVDTVAAGFDVTFLRPARAGDVARGHRDERVAARAGRASTTSPCRADGVVVAEFRGRSRALPGGTP